MPRTSDGSPRSEVFEAPRFEGLRNDGNGGRSGHDSLVDLSRRGGHLLAREALACKLPAGRAQLDRPRLVAEQLGEAAREPLGLPRLGQDPGDAVPNHLGDAAHARRHHRHAGRHRLDHRQRAALVVAREHDARGLGEQVGHVVADAEEAGRALDAQLGREPLGSRPVVAVADEPELRARKPLVDAGERAQHEVVTLGRREASDHEHSTRHRLRRPREALELDPVRDHLVARRGSRRRPRDRRPARPPTA